MAICTGVKCFPVLICIVDGGCNIGMYTLMVAAMGREVVAVDAMVDNLAYVRKSLELGTNNTGKVVLLHNSIR